MAEKDDIYKKIKRVDPKAAAIIDGIRQALTEKRQHSVEVLVTEDMSEDEEEMAIYEGLLKEGYPPDIAAERAKQWMSIERGIRG